MKTYYFIFGQAVESAYYNGGIKDVIKVIKKGDGYEIMSWNPDDNPNELLGVAIDWYGYAEITEKEYKKLINLQS